MFNLFKTRPYERNPEKRFDVFLEEHRAIKDMKHRVKRNRTLYIISPILIISIIWSLVGYNIFGYHTNDRLFNRYYETFNPEKEKLSYNVRAIKAYENKKYEKAIELFNKIDKNDSPINEYSLYLAISLIECERYYDAINTIENNLDTESLYNEVSSWYLGLCHLKLSSNEKAKDYFEKVAQFGLEYKSSAISILNDMD